MAVIAGKVRNKTDLFALVTARGDIAHIVENDAPRDAPGAGAAAAEAGAAAQAGSSSSSSSSSSGDGASVVRVRRTVDVKALNKRAGHTLWFVLELLLSTTVRSIIFMICLVTEPLAREHANALIYMKGGAARVRTYFGRQALQVWRHTVVMLFRVCTDLEALAKMGFVCDLGELDLDHFNVRDSSRCERWAAVLAGLSRMRGRLRLGLRRDECCAYSHCIW
jgi:hypothetical protein